MFSPQYERNSKFGSRKNSKETDDSENLNSSKETISLSAFAVSHLLNLFSNIRM
jgi:hypothetical protein